MFMPARAALLDSELAEGPAPSPLSAMDVGATVEVVGLDGDDDVSRRLLDFGFWPGTVVRVVRRAPFGDPTVYALRGMSVALRRSEAARVLAR